MNGKCIVKLNTGTGANLYLKSLFPIQWTEFISESELYSDIEDARMKLNSRHYQLSADLAEKGLDERYIELVCGKDIVRYIGG